MNIDDARSLFRRGASEALEILDEARAVHAGGNGWWPANRVNITDRTEATVLSHAVALRWAMDIPAHEQPRFLCMNTGRSKDRLSAPAKQRLLDLRRQPTDQHVPPFEIAGQTGLCFLRGEAMLDLVVFPDPAVVLGKQAKHVALLTMESEMCADHGVQPVISRVLNDYAWDFFKLVWLPSPRRLFVARVGAAKMKDEPSRIEALCEFLDTIVSSYQSAFAPDDVLVVIILAERDLWKSVIKVVVGGKVDVGAPWPKLFLRS